MELKETLYEIVSKDFDILKRHDEFLEALQEKVEEKEDYNTINRIMRAENLAAEFYDIKDLSGEEKQESVKEIKKSILADAEITEERLDYILGAFSYAIEPKIETSSQNLNLDTVLNETNLPENTDNEHQILHTDYSKKTSYCSADTRKSYFSFKGRINRKAYWIMGFKLLGLYLLACLAVALCENFSEVFAALILIVSSVIAIISSYSFAVRRFHDLNRTGWWALTFLIPYINLLTSLYAIFASGTEGDNDYGPDPLKI